MKLLGWLKGRGWLMVGLVSAALAGTPGCDDSGKKKVDQPDARNTLYGIWMDTYDQDDSVAPVYGIWGDVQEDIRPADADAIYLDAAVYGIWDTGSAEVDVEPEIAEVYGIFPADASADAKKADTDAEVPNPEVYGVWLDDVKAP